MIKYIDSEPASALPPCLKEDTDIMAISYAFKMAAQKMLQYSRILKLYADIDAVPENILDLLAMETRSQYYDESMDIEVKRKVIKNALAWYSKGGTVSAVNEMIEAVFGDGRMVEWYEYGGTPGTFYIETSAELSPDAMEQFNRIIENVKAKSSHLVNIKVERKIENPVFVAMYGKVNAHIVVKDFRIGEEETNVL